MLETICQNATVYKKKFQRWEIFSLLFTIDSSRTRITPTIKINKTVAPIATLLIHFWIITGVFLMRSDLAAYPTARNGTSDGKTMVRNSIVFWVSLISLEFIYKSNITENLTLFRWCSDVVVWWLWNTVMASFVRIDNATPTPGSYEYLHVDFDWNDRYWCMNMCTRRDRRQ